jgi:predicted Ser/Thr protein kinase
MIDDDRLGRILVESGRLSPEALGKLRSEGGPLSRLVVERGLVPAEDLKKITEHAAAYEPTLAAAPKRLGKFRLDAEIGRGGMGVVYRAWQDDLQRSVALKVLPETTDPGLKERFLREARTASRLRHPHIVAVHELGESEGKAWFAMDYVRGESLDAWMRREGRTLQEKIRAIATVARALAYAHGEGVVHRDIKPQNVLVGADGTPFLTDFGLARDLSASSPLTVTGQILGTPAFMSPEQARGGKSEVGPASDVYSLGAVLYVALAGKPPFSAESVYDLLDAIIKRPVPPPPAPGPLEAVCLKCLEKDPARRYPTAEGLAEDLESFLRGGAVSAAPARSVPDGRRHAKGVAPGGRRRPLAYALSAVAGLVLVWFAVLPQLLSSQPPRFARGTPPVRQGSLEDVLAGRVPIDAREALDRTPEGRREEEALDAIADRGRPAPLPLVSVAPREMGRLRSWRYPFASDGDLRDWSFIAGVAKAGPVASLSRQGDAVQVRGAELRFLVPLEGGSRISATVRPAAPGDFTFVLSLGGYRYVRTRSTVGVETVAGEALPGSPVRRPFDQASERATLWVFEDEVALVVGREELLRAKPPRPSRPLRPAIQVPREAVLLSDVRVSGRPRTGWEAEALAAADLLEGAGAKHAFGGTLAAPGAADLGFLHAEDKGVWTKEGDVLRGTTKAGERAELHGPDFRNSVLTFEYRVERGRAWTVRVRAGYREVIFPLPVDRPGEWRPVRIVAMEDEHAGWVDGSLRIASSKADGLDSDSSMLRFSMRDGEVLLRKIEMREVKGAPPLGPWTFLFKGRASGLDYGTTWTPREGLLVGEGGLRSRDAWRDFDAEMIFEVPRGARASLGARGAVLAEGELIPVYEGDISGFTFRVRDTWAVLEESWVYEKKRVADGAGPLTVDVAGGPVKLVALRVRPRR